MLAFSFPAALTSSLGMGVLHRISGKRLSIIGLSISGAVVHNLTQLSIAYVMFSFSRSVTLALAAILTLAAVGAGFVTGLIAVYLIRHLLPS
jgi:heptaprenyl diphosphate synthase